ncbi:M17 family metallopeptidase [Staphylococcus saccharolyticus]|uniref:M17 family metallopeptidase n=1 Tax=Staphylococcus saccharolyticus TaxID=33028 RepID=UPI0032DFD524
MRFHINHNNESPIETIIIGIPDHINQLGEIKYNQITFTKQIEMLKQHRIIGSQVGKISSTIFYIEDVPKRSVTVGLGNLKQLSYQNLLKVWGQLFQYLKQEHINEAELLLETFISKYVDVSKILKTLGLQSEQSIYQFDNYKSDKKAPYQPHIHIQTTHSDVDTLVKEGQQIGQSINLSRELSQMPPNILTPQYFAEQIRKHFDGSNVNVDIKDNEQLLSEGFGLLYAVGKGSSHGPRLITITYNGAQEDEDPIILVGKGITYDSGGYSIKSKTGMQTMKFDMCGAANVVGMIDAISKLQLPVNIVGIIASAENMINEASMKPDDVFTALNGETVEMLNSDAEGRMLLGDAVFYATQFKPQLILDFATLTGAAIVALGEDKAAAFHSDAKNELTSILNVAHTVDEKVFELPITDTEQQLIKKSDVADLVNHTNGQGKALFAAAFISHFSGLTPHIHFDIAGPATSHFHSFKGPKGPTGYMIPTIVEWMKQSYN